MLSDSTPTIFATVDGLRAAALGAYGQTSYETPALDAFAAEGTTYEFAYAPTADPSEVFAQMLPRMKQRSLILATDEPSLADRFGDHFRSNSVINLTWPDQVATTIDQMSIANVWASFAEAAVAAFATEEAQSKVLWLHTKGFYGPWDAPPELFEPLCDEEDPEVTAQVAPPECEPEAKEAADARFAASCRYAAQTMALDACFGGWLDVIDALFEGIEHRVVLSGTRGFSLGEHGQIGGTDSRLFSEQQHVPLLVRDSGPARRFMRRSSPTCLVQALLEEIGCGTPEEDAALVRSWSSSARTVRNNDWLLRKPVNGNAELYVWPDDRWEQNDVASLRPAVVEELLAEFPNHEDSGVALPAEPH